ncbi:putative calcium-binding protein [Ceratocystis platani]|uniref:Putative calcium-binding protein n=1 Tax=Ceratocystis fimbriata f. sp. platani TaxID=88771 RepID=A0A0F8DFH1_CERFI|nr:putative calcium-binding protein [Ceratocystis platani]
MAAEADPSAPVLNLTPEEKRVFGQLFRKADHDNVGVVTGDVAVSFFEKTRLDSHILGEIWQLADKENRGFLTPPGFGVVLRLIGHAQAGREPSLELALKPGPLPRFDAIPTPAGLGSGSMPSSMIAPPPPVAAPLQAQHTATGGPVRIPPLTPDKVAQFGALFEAQPLQAGFLSGDQARQIFEKSGLPNEILGRIWQLADTEQRGSLNSTEFVIAMHLLSALKTGAMRGLPTVLPSGLFEAASGRQSPAPTGSGIGIPPLPTQMSTNPPALRPAATGARPSTATIQSQSTGFGASLSNDWLVTPLEKQRFDQFYDDLDKTRRGYITGEEAVPFFSQSDLGEEALAQIWDLSDITATGTLTRDEFSVAMYLIRSQRSGRSGPLPSVLPPKLIPPSMRGPARPSTSASPFDAPMGSPVGMSSFAPPPVPAVPAAPAASKSALDDLFVLDSSPASPKPAASTDVSSSSNDPFANTPTGIAKPSSPPPLFKPFIPSSSFGRGLTQNVTGESRGSGSPAPVPAPASAANDLLGDNDPEMSSKLNNNSTELANLSNQISSLSTQMQNTQAQRSATQNELTQANSQKQNFEQRLTQLRSVYEKEAQNLRGLEEQLRTARSETTKLQAECMSLDGTYQDLQNQKAQVTAGLQTDQQENAALKEKIRMLNSEIAQLKPQIEKLRLEARQQKGLVAINKKQLITNEGERDKLKAEAEELSKSIDDSRAALAERSTSSASVSVSTPAARPQSPASSSAGNNPFFKRSASTDIKGVFSPASASPPSQAFGDSSFDDIFGVASSSAPLPGTAVSTPSPAIANAQQRENMGSSSASPSVSNSAFPPPAVVALSAPEKTTSPAPPGAFPFGEPASIAVAMTPRQTSPALSRTGGDAHSATSQATPAVVHNLATATSLSKSNSPAASSSPFAAPAFSSSPAPASVFPPPDSDIAATSTAAATVANVPTAETGNDPFASMRANDDPDKAKADFESAFASFKKSHNSSGDASSTETTKAFTTSKFNSEFPPVEEFDDDSDSSSDAGFDDDFAPLPPQPKPAADVTESKASQEQPEKTASPFDMGTTPASKTDIFGASPFAAPSAPPTSSVPTQPPAVPSNKASFDDLDDDFEGLEDAKEGSADDDFASLSRSGIDDFGHAFDNTSSSAPSQTKSDSVALGGSGGSFDFVSRGSPPPASGVPPNGPVPPVGSVATTTTGHDWESIFSGPEGGAATAASADSGALGAIGVATSTPPPATVQSESPAPGAPPVSTQPSTGDQALDNLLMMGYPKEAALRALERYDYNLERAANYLATNS